MRRRRNLLDAAIDTLPAPLAAFLETTIAYETLDRRVLECDPRLPSVLPARFRDLERSGAMFSVEEPQERYRLHPLFREAILARMRALLGSRATATLHRDASVLLERIGRTGAAFFHARESDDPAALAAFLQRNAYRLCIAGLGARAARTARGLEGTTPLAGGVAAQFAGMLARQRGEPGAEASFREALAQARKRGDALASASLRILLGEDAIARGERLAPDDIAEIGRIGRSVMPAARVDATLLAGWSAVLDHDLPRAHARAREARELAGDTLVARTRVVSLEAYTRTVLGDFAAADAALEETLRALEGSDHVVLLAQTQVWYARLALLWGDVAAAKDFATQGRALARRLDLAAELAGVELALAEIASHEGDVAATEAAFRGARALGASAWYAADRDRMEAHGTRFIGRAIFARAGAGPALAHLRAALGGSLPPERRAPLLADAAAFAVLTGDAAAPELDAFSEAAAAARVADGLDALTLVVAIRIAALARAAAGRPAVPGGLPAGIETAYGRLVAARIDLTASPMRAACSPPSKAARDRSRCMVGRSRRVSCGRSHRAAERGRKP